jgi:hypothetical protein
VLHLRFSVEIPGIATTIRKIRFQLAAKEFAEAGLLPRPDHYSTPHLM